MGSIGTPVPETIPTVDIGPFLVNPDSPQADDVVEAMRAACHEYGFFYLVGHQVADADREKALECTKLFHSLSQDEKREVDIAKSMGMSFRGWEPPALQKHHKEFLPDTKEAFILGREVPATAPEAGTISTGPNLWPSALSDEEFRLPLMDYHGKMLKLAAVILKILARGLPKEWNCPQDVFDGLNKEPSAPLRLLQYKPQPVQRPNQFGVGDHTDFGNVSIILGEPGRQGLEVWYPPTETWLPVPEKEGSYVINMGDSMAFWTAGYYRSARHRVVNGGTKTRHSVAFFLNGNMDLVCSQLDGSGKSTTVGEHLRRRLADTIGGEAGKRLAESITK